MSEENETKGFVSSVAGYFVKPIADQLAKEISDLWKLVSRQDNPEISNALLKIETRNIELQRKIRDLEYEINDVIEDKNTVPNLVAGTYFFEEKGPCCTVCFDKDNKKVVMTEKIVDPLITYTIFMAMIPFLIVMLSYMYTSLKAVEPITGKFTLIIILTSVIFLVMNYFLITHKSRKLEDHDKKSIVDLKCGVCRHKVSAYKIKLEEYSVEYRVEKLSAILEDFNKITIPIHDNQFSEISKKIDLIERNTKNLSEHSVYSEIQITDKLYIFDDILNNITELSKTIVNYNENINQVNNKLLKPLSKNTSEDNSKIIKILSNDKKKKKIKTPKNT